MVLKRIRRGLTRFLAALDSEGVALFQALVYLHVLVGGMYGALVAGGTPQAVEDSMGPRFNDVWLWLCCGTLICLYGKALRGRLAYTGMILQLVGDVCVFGVLVVYVIATLLGAWWGMALFAVFIVAAIAECVALLVFRDVRRLLQVERVRRRLVQVEQQGQQ